MINNFEKNVFINCPFDNDYQSLLKPFLFTLLKLGLNPRIASERLDSGEVRLSKIYELIESSKYAIHDLSRIKSKRKGEYFRMNMPFELGIDYGFRVFGGKKSSGNKSLIFSTKRYNYTRSLSDLAGIDIKAHNDDPENVVRGLRNWISNTLNKKDIPSPDNMWLEYQAFIGYFKHFMKEDNWSRREQNRMEPKDYIHYINKWKKDRSI